MENIQYSDLIVSKRTKDGDVIERDHRKFLEIANENLKDFNKRMKVVTQLKYNYIDNSFSIHSVSSDPRIQYLSRKFLIELNRYIVIVKEKFDQNSIKNEYVQNIEKDINDLQQEIRVKHRIQNKNGLTDREKAEYIHWITELIALRENSYPISVLTDKEIISKCKKEVNGLCVDLSKEFIIEKK